MKKKNKIDYDMSDVSEEYQAEQFCLEMESKAAELEITVDYYMMEFMDVEE